MNFASGHHRGWWPSHPSASTQPTVAAGRSPSPTRLPLPSSLQTQHSSSSPFPSPPPPPSHIWTYHNLTNASPVYPTTPPNQPLAAGASGGATSDAASPSAVQQQSIEGGGEEDEESLAPLYVGCFLAGPSRQRILERTPPQHCSVSAHHLTLQYRPTLKECLNLPWGAYASLPVIGAAADERAHALEVHLPAWLAPYFKNPSPPHVTISTAAEVPAKDAGPLIEAARNGGACAVELKQQMVLHGVVGVCLTDRRVVYSAGELQEALRAAAAAAGGGGEGGGGDQEKDEAEEDGDHPSGPVGNRTSGSVGGDSGGLGRFERESEMLRLAMDELLVVDERIGRGNGNESSTLRGDNSRRRRSRNVEEEPAAAMEAETAATTEQGIDLVSVMRSLLPPFPSSRPSTLSPPGKGSNPSASASSSPEEDEGLAGCWQGLPEQPRARFQMNAWTNTAISSFLRSGSNSRQAVAGQSPVAKPLGNRQTRSAKVTPRQHLNEGKLSGEVGAAGRNGGEHVAEAHRDVMLEHVNFIEAANAAKLAAMAQGDACAARVHADTAKRHSAAAASARQRASTAAYRSRNAAILNEFKLDLHGMHVKEAMDLLQRHIALLGRLDHPGGVLLRIITGYGQHSVEGRPKILPAVIRYLSDARIFFDTHDFNPGEVRALL